MTGLPIPTTHNRYIGSMIALPGIDTGRITNVRGGYLKDGKKVYLDVMAKLVVAPAQTAEWPADFYKTMYITTGGLPDTLDRIDVIIPAVVYKYSNNKYTPYCNAFLRISHDGTSTGVYFGTYMSFDVTQNEYYFMAHGEYDSN